MAEADRVVLTVPVRGEFARTVRIAAAELATRAEMDLDSVEDVRLGVEEAFVFASERAAGTDLTFTFQVAPGVIEVVVTPLAPGSGEDSSERGERYARFILESVCDEFELIEGDVCSLRLVKRSAQ
jgi:serine/threonine-protein kinase RsbW